MAAFDAPAFCWIPGRAADPAALARLRAQWPRRPREPMGEAWFMGETRRMFDELMGDLAAVDDERLCRALEEIGSGTQSFGHMQEWDDWFHFLFAPLIERLPRTCRRAGDSLLEYVVTALMSLHPDAVAAPPYAGFVEDVLMTLGRAVVAREPWGVDDPWSWVRDARSTQLQRHRTQGEFAASAFLHLKYLPADAVPAWTASMLDIPHPVWRAQVLPWLAGMADVSVGRSEDDRFARDNLEWAWSHALERSKGDVPAPIALPDANVQAMVATVRRAMNRGRYEAWLESFEPYPAVRDGLYDLPPRFERYYLR
jgi:hypothetical protein